MRKILAILFIFLSSCNRATRDNAIAKIDGNSIYANDIDNLISYQLYDMRQRVHVLRKIALEQYVNDLILKKEAANRGITKNKLIEQAVDDKITDSSLKQFAKDQHFDSRGLIS